MSALEPADHFLKSAHEDPVRDLVWLFSPEQQRDAVRALLDIEAEISRSHREGVDHSVSHARLEWWLQESQRLLAHRPAHPLTRRVAAAFLKAESSPPDLSALVEGAELDLACAAFDSRAALGEYFRLWADGLFRPLVLLCSQGLSTRAALEGFALQAGIALREIELIATLASDARQGRFHVPIGEDAAEHERWRMQPWGDDCARSMALRLEDCSRSLCAAAAALPADTIRAQRPALVWCALGLLASRHAALALPLQPVRGRWNSVQATWVAWRSAIAAERGTMPLLLRTTT